MRNATRLLDILDRAESGPITDEKEFEKTTLPGKMKELQARYEIKIDRTMPYIPADDDLADRVFQAGMDLAVEIGILCVDTGRRITFTREEVLQALRFAPAEVTLGDPPDEHVQRKRQVEGSTRPTMKGGPVGTVAPEELYLFILQSYAQEPLVDAIIDATLGTVYGREGRSHSPWEVLTAWQEAALSKEAVRRAGRPGLGIGCVENSVSEIGELSATCWGAFGPRDWHHVCFISELKTNYALLSKVSHLVKTGCVIHSYYNPIFGGYVGGPEGVAIATAGGIILMQMVNLAATHSVCPTHPFNENDTDPDIVRALSVAQQAINRNTHLLTDVVISPVGGPCTKVLLYECAAMAVMATVCGASALIGPRSTAGRFPGHMSGLESRFSAEVAHVCTGMSREQANEIVSRIIPLYQEYLDKRPIGKRFDQAYDLSTLKPTTEWQGMYEEVKKEMVKLGIPFS